MQPLFRELETTHTLSTVIFIFCGLIVYEGELWNGVQMTGNYDLGKEILVVVVVLSLLALLLFVLSLLVLA